MTEKSHLDISHYTPDQLQSIAKHNPDLLEQIRVYSENKVIESANTMLLHLDNVCGGKGYVVGG